MSRIKRIAETLDRASLHRMFSTPDKCMTWLESALWENGEPVCPRCKRTDKIWESHKRPHQYRCGYCLRWFNVRTGTALHATKRPLIDWIIAMHIMVPARKGISAMQLSKELGIAYKTAWHLLHRLRYSCAYPAGKLSNHTEGDEHYMGGKQKNKHVHKQVKGAQGGAAMARIVGICDRVTGETRLLYTPDKSDESILNHIYENVELGTAISTDELRAYKKLEKDYPHLSVCHSKKEWKDGEATVNSMESRWAVVVRTITGTYHHISIKNLPLYLREMAFRFNQGNCEIDTIDRMVSLAQGMAGRTLTFETLVGRKRTERKWFWGGRAPKRAKPVYRGYAARKNELCV